MKRGTARGDRGKAANLSALGRQLLTETWVVLVANLDVAPVREGEGTLVLATQLLRGAEEASGKRTAML